MAGLAFPSWAYNLTQPSQIVASQAALTALGSGWQTTPFVGAASLASVAPADPGFTDTDIRLQQILEELRVLNIMTKEIGQIRDEVDNTGLRADINAQDIGLTT